MNIFKCIVCWEVGKDSDVIGYGYSNALYPPSDFVDWSLGHIVDNWGDEEKRYAHKICKIKVGCLVKRVSLYEGKVRVSIMIPDRIDSMIDAGIPLAEFQICFEAVKEGESKK